MRINLYFLKDDLPGYGFVGSIVDSPAQAHCERPMICEEYMARNRGSYFDAYLPVFKRNKVGAINWGLVNKNEPGTKPNAIWQHGIYYNDARTPYCQAEIDFIKEILADKSTAGQNPDYPIKPE